MNMNTFPLALSKKLEGGGKRWGGRRSWVEKVLGMRGRVAQGPAGQNSFPGPGAARGGEPPLRFACELSEALAKVSPTEFAEESPCARMRINPRREDWRPRALLVGSNGILRARSDSSYEQA